MARRRAHPGASGCVVALLTDFGCSGHHAGVLRGAVLSGNPAAGVVDLSNGIPAGDVVLGAWTLRWSWRHFPPGTVHLAIVDPGVGTPRRALAAAAGGQFFVGPDNGLLSYALGDAGDARVVSLAPPRVPTGISATFHGRDLFAPVAARLSGGAALARLGERTTDWVRLPEPLVRITGGGRVEGEVIAVDHWGNLVTSLTQLQLAPAGIGTAATVRVGRRAVRGLRRTYGEVRPGAPVALLNSNGHLEVGVNRGRADQTLRAGRGTPVTVSA
jgi:S-adenosyl-L-methionine hydrolase (adenosine-forming)